MRAAVFSCLGLGDGLNALVLSYNLQRHGYIVDTFHPFLQEMQTWFPFTTISSLEKFSLDSLLGYDKIFLFHEKTDQMLAVQTFCQERCSHTCTILNPIATLHNDYPFWGNGKFDGRKTFADNVVDFCKKTLHLQESIKSCGIIQPSHVTQRKFPRRIVIHPTSSLATRNWSWDKFLMLKEEYKKRGWDPYFLLMPQEKAQYPGVSEGESPDIHNLIEMALFIAESGIFIGNDSGPGHLASALGVPTLTICRSYTVASFWRPGFAPGEVVAPYSWLPNFKGFRWRDHNWQRCVSVSKVLRASEKFMSHF